MNGALAFDLDGTLAKSKQSISRQMAETLSYLTKTYHLAIVTGGSFFQIQTQVIEIIEMNGGLFNAIHVFPTSGAQCYKVHQKEEPFLVFQHLLSEKEIQLISSTMDEVAKRLNLYPHEHWGEVIENRKCQVTFSALGQLAPIEEKTKWDVSGQKRKNLKDELVRLLPGYGVKVGGLTSVDVTRSGIDKAYALRVFANYINTQLTKIYFFGDQIYPNGNDYCVKETEVRYVSVRSPEETLFFLKKMFY